LLGFFCHKIHALQDFESHVILYSKSSCWHWVIFQVCWSCKDAIVCWNWVQPQSFGDPQLGFNCVIQPGIMCKIMNLTDILGDFHGRYFYYFTVIWVLSWYQLCVCFLIWFWVFSCGFPTINEVVFVMWACTGWLVVALLLLSKHWVCCSSVHVLVTELFCSCVVLGLSVLPWLLVHADALFGCGRCVSVIYGCCHCLLFYWLFWHWFVFMGIGVLCCLVCLLLGSPVTSFSKQFVVAVAVSLVGSCCFILFCCVFLMARMLSLVLGEFFGSVLCGTSSVFIDLPSIKSIGSWIFVGSSRISVGLSERSFLTLSWWYQESYFAAISVLIWGYLRASLWWWWCTHIS